MAKKFIRQVGPHAKLFRDTKTGIVWIADGATGLGFSAHPNIDESGSVEGMKELGYWGKDDRVVLSHGYYYNIDHWGYAEEDKYTKICCDECMCKACRERRAKC